MALEQEKLLLTQKKYFDTTTKLGVMNDELMAFFGESYRIPQATNWLSYYNAFEGGLIEHLLRVSSYAVLINKSLPEDERVSQESLLKVCLLHQIKTFSHCCTSEWHRKKSGKKCMSTITSFL
jgi:HD superfamily phosphodiesterase